MKRLFAGLVVWLAGNFVLVEMYQLNPWAILAGYTLGLITAFIMIKV